MENSTPTSSSISPLKDDNKKPDRTVNKRCREDDGCAIISELPKKRVKNQQLKSNFLTVHLESDLKPTDFSTIDISAVS